MGKKSSTTKVESYKPTSEEKRLMEQAADYAEAVAPNSLALNNEAAKLLFGSYGTVQADFDQMNADAQAQIANAQTGLADLAAGHLPAAYQQNMQTLLDRTLTNTLGTQLQGLADRGILNSSVTQSAISGISTDAANALAQTYQSNINDLTNLYNQQLNAAALPIDASAAAQEAAQNPALRLWNASIGLNNAVTGALGAVGQRGERTSTTPSSGLIGGVITGAAANYFCFTGDTQIATPKGDRAIRHIKPGDTVLAAQPDGTCAPAQVLATLTPRYSDTYTLLTDTHAVHTTLSQPFTCADGIDRTLADLTIGTELALAGHITGIVHSGRRKVYDLKISGTNHYLANGFLAKGGDSEWDS